MTQQLPKFVTEDLIFMTLAGSHMYGTNTPDSDIDLRGVCIPPPEVELGFARNFETIKFENEDTEVHSLKKFLTLVMENNPNIIELLYAPDDCVKTITPLWERLRERRDEFISAKCKYTFSGYAHNQLKRLKGHREWLRNPPSHQPTREEFGLEKAGSGLVKAAKGVDVTQISPEAAMVIEKEKRYKAAMRHWDNYQRWIRERNPARAKLERAHSYDTKHAMHLVRILRMGREILTTGKVIVRRPDAEELLAIRNGKWSLDELLEYVEGLDVEVDDIYGRMYPDYRKKKPGEELPEIAPEDRLDPVLPYSPPKAAMSDLCVELYRKYWHQKGCGLCGFTKHQDSLSDG